MLNKVKLLLFLFKLLHLDNVFATTVLYNVKNNCKKTGELAMTTKKIIEGNTVSIRFPLNVAKDVLEWVNKQTSINNSIISLIKKEISSNGITDLGQNDNYIPTEKEILPYVFEYIAKQNDSALGANVQEIYEYCSKKLNVSSKQRNIPSKANISRYENRASYIYEVPM
jgi:hypothetical protein